MRSPTPPAPLFPYTTLFRSGLVCPPFLDRLLLLLAATAYPALPGGTRVLAARRVVRDRKSTRLNSSHANISYAVFCLKKKIWMGEFCCTPRLNANNRRDYSD